VTVKLLTIIIAIMTIVDDLEIFMADSP